MTAEMFDRRWRVVLVRVRVRILEPVFDSRATAHTLGEEARQRQPPEPESSTYKCLRWIGTGLEAARPKGSLNSDARGVHGAGVDGAGVHGSGTLGATYSPSSPPASRWPCSGERIDASATWPGSFFERFDVSAFWPGSFFERFDVSTFLARVFL